MKDKKMLGAIILAAGKGKRMNSKNINKVVLPLNNKPMILHTFDLLRKLNISSIIVVVGFAKNSVMKLLDKKAIFAEQKKRLGTGHALSCALKKLPSFVSDVVVLNGDDSAFYNIDLLEKLVKRHYDSNASVTFLSIKAKNPFGLGRVIRDDNGKVKKIVEEKDATEEQKKICEINPACYIFNVDFLKKYIKYIKKSPVTKEYYIVNLIELASKNNKYIETLSIDNLIWRGVNTKEELDEAEKLFVSA